MASSLIQVYLDREVFTLNELPSSLAQLQFLIEEVFTEKLPSYWSLKFQDDYGKLAPLVTSEDYQFLLDHYSFFSNEVKICIISREEVDPLLTQSKINKEEPDKVHSESFDIVSEGKNSFQSESESDEVLDNLDFEIKEISLEEDVMSEQKTKDFAFNIQDKIKENYFSKAPRVEQASSPIRTSHIEQSSQTDIQLFGRQIPPIQSNRIAFQEEERPETKNMNIQTDSKSLNSQNKETQFNSASPKRKNQAILTKNKLNSSPTLFSDDSSFSVRRKSLTLEVPSPYVVKQDDKEEVKVDQKLRSPKQNIQLNHDKEAIQEVVLETMSANLPQFALLVKDYLDASSLQKARHGDCYCDGCGILPIMGVRYKCSVCRNFDFCENCEATKEHPHLFLKINHPNDYPKLNQQKKSLNKVEGDEFSLRNLGKKLKETTLMKVLTNTYGQIPDHLMKTLSKVFKSFKSDSVDSPCSQDDSQSSEDYYSNDEEDEEEEYYSD